ncbi:hypothetical protein BN2497_2125 [Janthinobacterium sp. CG23_2]|nr:hypothetical protein BN2497_2125 [Janthinobacterium sp. CG23_2]CUU27460.1 hypothetical protein BN3177_2125 [Janthinobacterium sp. CG23_2]
MHLERPLNTVYQGSGLRFQRRHFAVADVISLLVVCHSGTLGI